MSLHNSIVHFRERNIDEAKVGKIVIAASAESYLLEPNKRYYRNGADDMLLFRRAECDAIDRRLSSYVINGCSDTVVPSEQATRELLTRFAPQVLTIQCVYDGARHLIQKNVSLEEISRITGTKLFGALSPEDRINSKHRGFSEEEEGLPDEYIHEVLWESLRDTYFPRRKN